jgi:hypothetical protein
MILFREAVSLKRRKQTVHGALVKPEPLGNIRRAHLAFRLCQQVQNLENTINNLNAVEGL